MTAPVPYTEEACCRSFEAENLITNLSARAMKHENNAQVDKDAGKADYYSCFKTTKDELSAVDH